MSTSIQFAHFEPTVRVVNAVIRKGRVEILSAELIAYTDASHYGDVDKQITVDFADAGDTFVIKSDRHGEVYGRSRGTVLDMISDAESSLTAAAKSVLMPEAIAR